jgi:NifU-like protein involved in Fe-S cluster formation
MDDITSNVRHLAGCEGTPGQGAFMAVVLEVSSSQILRAHYQTYPCPAAHSCGRFVTEWLTCKTVEEAANLSSEIILSGVGQMPLGREHCPGLTVSAVKRALESDPV